MTFTLEESYAWCQALSRRTARNFYFSFRTLPREQFRDMCALYAFMRVCDDLGDDNAIPATQRAENLSGWQRNLESALTDQRYEHILFPALTEIVSRHEIPPRYLSDVIEGVRTDLQPAGFDTFEDLSRYCYQVAGAVGLCCIHIWGFHGESAVDRAIDCGIAFQLTNILRDLGEDAAMGRIYLPREDLLRFDVSESDIANHRRNEPFRNLMQFEVDRARDYYAKADELFTDLDPPGIPIYAAMLKLYKGLLDEIERRDFDVFSKRIRLPFWKKLSITLGSIARYRRRQK